jgi:hypothetical protein
LWHHAGLDENGVVLEVKFARARAGMITNDVDNLRAFADTARYPGAMLLVIGESGARDASEQFHALRAAAERHRVDLVFHTTAGQQLSDCYLPRP